jgi:AcrR family transcriptional regulator
MVPPMPRRAKRRPDEPGRDKLIAAGRHVFGEHGFDAATTAQIADRAAISKSVLYHYFGSKADLYRAILEVDTRELLDKVAAAVATVSPAGPRLRPGIDAYLRFLWERPASWRLLLRDAPSDPGLLQLHDRLRQERATALGALLSRPGKASHGVAAQALYTELLTIAIRAFADWWYDHRDTERDRVLEAILDFAAAGTGQLTGSGHEQRAV